MPNLLKRGRKLVKVGRKLAKATAACIARCCRRCPGPVLRRKCDRYCPDTNIAYGFWRIDLDAPIAPGGITWRQWIADNDAALTPCRLIQFGTDPENCYVLDRNCSRCFWSGCNYQLDIPSLPVVPTTWANPRLAECRDCLVCDVCCESALLGPCGQNVCRECGSSYTTHAVGYGHSVINNYTSGPTTPPVLNETSEVTNDYTVDGRNVCTATNNECTARTMVTTWFGSRRSQVRNWTLNGTRNYDYDESVSGTTGGPDSAYLVSEPIRCGDMISLRPAMVRMAVQFGTGRLANIAIPPGTIRQAVLGSRPAGFLGDIGLGSGQYAQCSNSITLHSGGPFEGEWLTDETISWAFTPTRNGATLTLTYARDSYLKSDRTRPRYLVSDIRAQHRIEFTISTIDDCEPGAANGCHDPLRRKRDDASGIGNGAEDIDGILAP